MTSLTIENVPDDLLERLKRSAERHRRSLDSEVIERLEKSAPPQAEPEPRIDPEKFLAEVHELRTRLNVPPLTDEFLEHAINEGRP